MIQTTNEHIGSSLDNMLPPAQQTAELRKRSRGDRSTKRQPLDLEEVERFFTALLSTKVEMYSEKEAIMDHLLWNLNPLHLEDICQTSFDKQEVTD